MKGKMKAQLFYGPEDVRFGSTDIPKIRNDEVLVRIRSALTCGSDLKTYRRGNPTMINAAKFITSDMPLERLVDALELVGSQKGIKYNIIA